jgi:hypothetical protein
MDLVVVDSSVDFLCIKSASCRSCTESKLNLKVIYVIAKISGDEFLNLKKNYGIAGVSIKCECH